MMNIIITFLGRLFTAILGLYFLFIFVMFLITMVILEKYNLLHHVNTLANTL